MTEEKDLAAKFEANRAHLRSVALRMLGSQAEADDAVQEAWLHVAAADTTDVTNMTGWMTVVTARVCLDLLRARKRKREDATAPADDAAPAALAAAPRDPEHEVALADSIGLALLVVLETLEPAERVAFVLHDMFDLPFEEIAPIVDRSPAAARQLASRARRRVQGAEPLDPDRSRQKEIVTAFLAASKGGDFSALLAVLAPNVVLDADAEAVRRGHPKRIEGANEVAQNFLGKAKAARAALVDGAVGAAVIVNGKTIVALRFRFDGEAIAAIDAVLDPAALAEMDISILE